MKKVNEQRSKKGFTLLEMLVVVLIIGILAGIALPQYQMAVTKAKVASILPIMRRWKDALTEWELQHGNYLREDGQHPNASDLGVNWPSDWECDYELETACHNDEWDCETNTGDNGDVDCRNDALSVRIYQYDDGCSCSSYAESFANKIICQPVDSSDLGKKVCANMGRLVEGCTSDYVIGG